jgi:hypothetical protein
MNACASLAIATLVALGGCAALAPPMSRDSPPDGEVARCERLYRALDEAVAAAGAPDGGEARASIVSTPASAPSRWATPRSTPGSMR